MVPAKCWSPCFGRGFRYQHSRHPPVSTPSPLPTLGRAPSAALPPPRRPAPRCRRPRTHSLWEVAAAAGAQRPLLTCTERPDRWRASCGVVSGCWPTLLRDPARRPRIRAAAPDPLPTSSRRRGGSPGGSDSPSCCRRGVCGERSTHSERQSDLRLGGRTTETCCKVREAAGSLARGPAGQVPIAPRPACCHRRGRAPRRDVGVSHPALTETARRAQLAASEREREREPRLRGGRRAGSPALGPVRNHSGGGRRRRPGSAERSTAAGTAPRACPARSSAAENVELERAACGRGGRRPPGGEGRPAPHPAGHGDSRLQGPRPRPRTPTPGRGRLRPPLPGSARCL